MWEVITVLMSLIVGFSLAIVVRQLHQPAQLVQTFEGTAQGAAAGRSPRSSCSCCSCCSCCLLLLIMLHLILLLLLLVLLVPMTLPLPRVFLHCQDTAFALCVFTANNVNISRWW